MEVKIHVIVLEILAAIKKFGKVCKMEIIGHAVHHLLVRTDRSLYFSNKSLYIRMCEETGESIMMVWG